ncbi:tryptophan synthase subunit alpha [Lactiplantibacillus argentoratensis]|uniref:tryptophan synthase subunit alpha n=1 Tax=Lactiplantibacillus argentoratensis TaxID=271881 RepID=UPI0006EF11A5|nr:tryptophan synthase subunit alpha [Lactiplantibacillus argentoratensis]KRL97927.1 tryptophan synthase alpha chain [Lactiplantibacillus argentoratensis DSM 16365]GEO54691.1 hypothetical protein LPL03_27870 [Lactiplantibacillus argentoratensis]
MKPTLPTLMPYRTHYSYVPVMVQQTLPDFDPLAVAKLVQRMGNGFALTIDRHHHDVALIPLIAPTSDDTRIAAIAAQARGFIYVVSSLGVTGPRNHITTDLTTLVTKIRQVTPLPVAIGFGIHDPAQAHAMAKFADGVIVGSAVVHLIANNQPATTVLTDYTRQMRAALDAVTVSDGEKG